MYAQEKIIMTSSISKEYKRYYGLYVALDDKDRLISYGKNKQKVYGEAKDFSFWFKEHGIKLYKIYDVGDRQLIKSLLDDVF